MLWGIRILILNITIIVPILQIKNIVESTLELRLSHSRTSALYGHLFMTKLIWIRCISLRLYGMAWESMQARGLKIPKPLFLKVVNIKSIRYTMILSYITSITIIENHKSPITMVLALSLCLHMPLPMTYCHWYQWPSLWQWFSRWRKKCPPFLQRTIKEVEGHIKAPWVTLRDFPPPRGICSSILNV